MASQLKHAIHTHSVPIYTDVAPILPALFTTTGRGWREDRRVNGERATQAPLQASPGNRLIFFCGLEGHAVAFEMLPVREIVAHRGREDRSSKYTIAQQRVQKECYAPSNWRQNML